METDKDEVIVWLASELYKLKKEKNKLVETSEEKCKIDKIKSWRSSE